MLNPYGTLHTIYRKRNLYAFDFLLYLDGRDSVLQEWDDRSANDNDAQNGNTSGVDADDAVLIPYGYRAEGVDEIGGNLGVSASTITAFTFGGVFVLDDITGDHALIYRLFGSNDYPRIYCTGGSIYAEIELDAGVITLSTTLSGKVVNGKPFSVAVRGDITNGIDLLIDEVEVDTDATTGTAFDTDTGAFVIAEDPDQSYNLSGEVRMVYALETNLSDAHLTALRSMLDYEGFFDVIRDAFGKWSGSGTITGFSPVVSITNSPYVGTGNEIE